MDIFFREPVYFWLVMVILFVVVELATFGLTSIWFAIGALAGIIAAELRLPFLTQFIIFSAVSLVMLFLLRKNVMAHFNKNRIKTNADSLVGKQAVVIETVSNLQATGRVKIAGQEWMARAVKEDATYEKDAVVTVRSISGVKLIVEQE